MSDVLKVDVWSDIACPWCYVGKRRFEAGVRRYRDRGGDREVRTEYHSFQLMPDAPEEYAGTSVDFLCGHLRVPAPQAEQIAAQMTQLAASEGLHLDYARQRPANTAKAHELLHLAKDLGRQADLKERLLRAHWTEGRDVGRVDELVAIAVESGLDAAEARAALESDRFADAVAADLRLAREIGVTGVPFFVVDDRFAVSGAQPPDVFAQVLEQAARAARVA